MTSYKASDFRIKRRARWAKAFSQAELRAAFAAQGGAPGNDARVIQNIGHDIILRRLKGHAEGVPGHARKEITLALRVCFEIGHDRPYGFDPLYCHPVGTLSPPDAAGAEAVFDELARRINQGMTDSFRRGMVTVFNDLSASREIVPALVWAWNEGRAMPRP